jgi:hypothetical protein
VGAALLCEFVGRVVVYVGGARSPTPAEWDAHIAALREHVASHPDSRSLVFASGVRLSPTQRKQLADVMPKSARSSVLTASTVDRGVVTALSWFVGGIKAFAPTDEDGAIAFLDLSASEIPPVKEASKRLRAKISSA